MNQQLTVLIPEAALCLFLVCAFVLVLTASIYDIRQTMQKKSMRRLQSKFRRLKKPTISVIVQAHNNAESIKLCLDSIRRNRYSHYDIVVVDNKSTDETRREVRFYMQKHPSLPLRLYSKRHKISKLESIIKGYKCSRKGDLVLDINATSVIPKSLLMDCASRFWYDNQLQVLHFNVNNVRSDSVNLLYFRFRQLCGSMLNKSLSLVSKYKSTPDSGGVIFRYGALLNTAKSQSVSANYSSGLVVSDYSAFDDKTAISMQISSGGGVYYLFAVILILLQTYSIYLAAAFQINTLLIIGWLATAVFLLLATWSSEALNNKDKITLSLCAPFIYFLIYLQLIMNIFYVVARSFLIGVMASQE